MHSEIFCHPRGIPVGIAIPAPISAAVFLADVPAVHTEAVGADFGVTISGDRQYQQYFETVYYRIRAYAQCIQKYTLLNNDSLSVSK